MIKKIAALLFFVIFASCNQHQFYQEYEARDIANFWEAYDNLVVLQDTLKQKQIFREQYLDRATKGLNNIIEVRGYTENEYLHAIKSYPEFWNSIRSNTLQTATYQDEINRDITKLQKLYPDLKHSKIYFTIGAFRTNGTILGNTILIGSELAFADDETVIHELPEWRQPFYKTYQPLKDLALLCTHEYVHTQQKELVQNLLSMCLYEGIAEFVSCLATGKQSTTPAINFGKENKTAVVNQFVDDLYLMTNNSNWLWGENDNHLKIRDLGYFIGYEIAERYYNQATDKNFAIKELIELDYTNEKDVERIVDESNVLPKTISHIYNEYEQKRPKVIRIEEFMNGDKAVDPSINTITVQFSEELNGRHTGLDFGPLGTEFYPNVDNETRKWGADNKSYTFEVKLAPNKKYQMVIGSNFRLANGIRLKPYIIEFQTKK